MGTIDGMVEGITETLGSLDGAGLIEGFTDGSLLGRLDGLGDLDGLEDGCRLGALDGLGDLLGSREGFLDGLREGRSEVEGREDGFLEGNLEGLLDGFGEISTRFPSTTMNSPSSTLLSNIAPESKNGYTPHTPS